MFLPAFFRVQPSPRWHILSIGIEEVTNPLVKFKRAVVEEENAAVEQENTAARMQKMAEEMRFRLKEAMAQRGGSEAFLHWLRSDAGKKA
jgi:hypothetical protein